MKQDFVLKITWKLQWLKRFLQRQDLEQSGAGGAVGNPSGSEGVFHTVNDKR